MRQHNIKIVKHILGVELLNLQNTPTLELFSKWSQYNMTNPDRDFK